LAAFVFSVATSVVGLAKANPLVPPTIVINSPQNEVYFSTEVQLNFSTLPYPYPNLNFTSFTYSLDGQTAIAINGNATLIGLSYGSHAIQVYGKDTSGHTYSTQVTHFHVYFHTLWAAAGLVLLTLASTTAGVYVWKRQQINAALKRKKTKPFWVGLAVFALTSFLVFETILYYLDFTYFTTHSSLIVNVSYVFVVPLLLLMAAGVYWMKAGLRKKPSENEPTV